MGEPLYTIEGNTHSMAFPDGERLEGVQPHLDHTGRLWVRVTAFLPNGNLAHRTRMDLLNQRELEQFHQTATAMDGQFNIDWRGRLLYFQQQVLYTLETPEADTAVAVDDAAEAWPVLADAALHGLVGEIVRTIDPYTEADRMAILLNILVGVGNLLGTTPMPASNMTGTPHGCLLCWWGRAVKAARAPAGVLPGTSCRKLTRLGRRHG
jgi:hypothetical protein